MALKIFVTKKNNIVEALNKYAKSHKKKTGLLDYYFELINTSIITKNTILMKFIIENVKIDNKFELFYYKVHLNNFYLMCAYYYKLQNKKTEERKYAKLFNIEDTYFSYQDYLKLIHLVYLYSDAKKLKIKNKILNDYLVLSKKLNYPYFSKSYLLNYFIDS